MKLIIKILLCINTISFAMDNRNQIFIQKTIIESLLNITPNALDTMYYFIIPSDYKNKILKKFYKQNRWRIKPLELKNVELKTHDIIKSIHICSISTNYSKTKKTLSKSLPITNWSKTPETKTTESKIYFPYMQAVTPGSINSKFALKIINKKKYAYFNIGTYLGEKLKNWHLIHEKIIQGAFSFNDNHLTLVTNINKKTFIKTLTCGYTPEQMLCILAYHNAKHNIQELKILIKTKIFTSLLNKKCTITEKILKKIKNILKHN